MDLIRTRTRWATPKLRCCRSRHLKLAEATLADAVDRLDSAYKSFSSTDGAKGTPAAVKMSAAEKAVNAICPDAAP